MEIVVVWYGVRISRSAPDDESLAPLIWGPTRGAGEGSRINHPWHTSRHIGGPVWAATFQMHQMLTVYAGKKWHDRTVGVGDGAEEESAHGAGLPWTGTRDSSPTSFLGMRSQSA